MAILCRSSSCFHYQAGCTASHQDGLTAACTNVLLFLLSQVGLFPSRQAAQHAIAPAMEQQRQWFDKLRAELAPPAGKGSKKGQGSQSGLLSSEQLTF